VTYDEPRGVLFTGRLGAGKSTLAIDTFAVLAEAEPPAAALDLDWLALGKTPAAGPDDDRGTSR
jgi:adenylylsulfate kinase-like enzyme